MVTVAATLIVSLSGLDDAHLDDCARLADDLDSRRVPVSWLLPARPPAARHRADAPAIAYLRDRAVDHAVDQPAVRAGDRTGARAIGTASADSLVMHGYDHTADPIGCWRPTQLTRIGRKAEFAALPHHEAGLRLLAATRALGELGLATDVFAPPRWLASEGTLTALRTAGFRVCADSAGVRLLGPGVLLRGRPLEVGPPDAPNHRTETLRWRGLVVTTARAARRGHLVRVAVRAADLGRPGARRALLDAVDAALAAGAAPTGYARPVPRVSSAALSA